MKEKKDIAQEELRQAEEAVSQAREKLKLAEEVERQKKEEEAAEREKLGRKCLKCGTMHPIDHASECTGCGTEEELLFNTCKKHPDFIIGSAPNCRICAQEAEAHTEEAATFEKTVRSQRPSNCEVQPGTLLWEFKTGGLVHSSPAIGADGTVYFGSNDNKVYALDGASGAKKWEFETGYLVYSSPAMGSDGTVYVGSWDRKVYAIATDSNGPAKSPWPMFGQNAQRIGRVPKR